MSERAVLILRQEATRPALRHPIEARLAAAGFTIVSDSLHQVGPTDQAPKGCRPGRNLVEVVERPKAAVQVLRELVGAYDHPGSGTIRAVYGKDAVWCAEDGKEVDQAIAELSDDSPRERRVFTFTAQDEPARPDPILVSPPPPTDSPIVSPPMLVSPPLSATTPLSATRTVSSSTSFSVGDSSTSSSRAAGGDPGPRMSKAACLRLGIPWSPPARSLSASTASSSLDPATPGMGRRALDASELPASLLPPIIAPRQTKASALRAGAPASASSSSASSSARTLSSEEDVTLTRKDPSELYASTPGHKNRRASLQLSLPSTASPRVAPRPTRSSALRASYGGQVDPSQLPLASPNSRRESLDTRFRGVAHQGNPGFKRLERVEVPALKRPDWAPKPNRASMLRSGSGGGAVDDLSRSTSRSSSVGPYPGTPRRASTALGLVEDLDEAEEGDERVPRPTFQGVPGHKRDVSISVASSRPPSMTPRLNRAAALRAGQPVTSFSEPRPQPRPTFSSSVSSPAAPFLPSGHPTTTSKRVSTIVPRSNKSASLRASTVDASSLLPEKENRGVGAAASRTKHSSETSSSSGSSGAKALSEARNGTLRAKLPPGSFSSLGSSVMSSTHEGVRSPHASIPEELDLDDQILDIPEEEADEGGRDALGSSISPTSTTTSPLDRFPLPSADAPIEAAQLETPSPAAVGGDYFAQDPSALSHVGKSAREEEGPSYGHVTIISSSERRVSPVAERRSLAV